MPANNHKGLSEKAAIARKKLATWMLQYQQAQRPGEKLAAEQHWVKLAQLFYNGMPLIPALQKVYKGMTLKEAQLKASTIISFGLKQMLEDEKKANHPGCKEAPRYSKTKKMKKVSSVKEAKPIAELSGPDVFSFLGNNVGVGAAVGGGLGGVGGVLSAPEGQAASKGLSGAVQGVGAGAGAGLGVSAGGLAGGALADMVDPKYQSLAKLLGMLAGGTAGGMAGHKLTRELTGSDKPKYATIYQMGKQALRDGDGDGVVAEGTPEERRKEKKHKARTKLGPVEHAYVADAIGGKSMQNLGKKLQEMQLDPDNEYDDLYSQLLSSQGGMNQIVGERVNRGASRLSENTPWRLAAHLDPTSSGDGTAGIIGLLSGVGGGKDKAEGAKRRTSEAYTKFLKPHQDKLDAGAVGTDRSTPWHLDMQATHANLDSDVAGHRYMRKERPGHYWLNPLDSSGPFNELGDRGLRRMIAGTAQPDSTAGRAGMALGGIGTLGLLPLITGGHDAQNKLRASAMANNLYGEEAVPETEKVSTDAPASPASTAISSGPGAISTAPSMSMTTPGTNTAFAFGKMAARLAV